MDMKNIGKGDILNLFEIQKQILSMQQQLQVSVNVLSESIEQTQFDG
jgi:hypothetical protein